MSSFSVNARGHAPGSVIAACRRWSRVIASTRLAEVRSAAQTMRLRCGVISIPYEAMTETTSGCGGSPSPIIPAERTGTVTPSVASRRASSAAAIGDRHTFAVHSMRTPGSAGVSRCAGGIWEMPSLSFILILPEIIFRPLLGPVRGTFRDRVPCLVWTFILSRLRLSYTHFLQRTPGGGASTGFPWPLRSWVPAAAILQTREIVTMTESDTEPTFRAYLQILRQRKWWVGSIAVLGLAASLVFSLTAHKQYSATAQLLVQPSVVASGLGVAQQPVTQTDVDTELQLVTSAPVQQAVRAQLKSTPAVSASEVGQTNVMAITATSPVPPRAALIANLYANAFVQYRQAVASRSLASAEAQLRSQISSIGQQLRSFHGS